MLFFQIDQILEKAGVSETIRSNLMFGEFTPVNYSQKRFETKVNTIRNELDKISSDGKFRLDLNTDFVFPEFALDNVKMEYDFKKFLLGIIKILDLSTWLKFTIYII